MGRRGPPPKPTILKLAGGNPGKKKIDPREVVPSAGEPVAPEWISEQALAIWKRLVPELAKSGLARSLDGWTLARYCVILARWIELDRFIRTNGTTYPQKSADGKRVLRVFEFPQAGEWRKLGPQLTALEREFGLTPASRTRIRAEQEGAAGGDVDELKRRFFEPRSTSS